MERYFMRIICQKTILTKYHAIFVIFEKAAIFEIVFCCKLYVALYGFKVVHSLKREAFEEKHTLL